MILLTCSVNSKNCIVWRNLLRASCEFRVPLKTNRCLVTYSTCCSRRWDPFILCENIHMLNLLIQKEFSSYVLEVWVFKLVLFASLLHVIFSVGEQHQMDSPLLLENSQLDGSLERLFQSVKKITRKNLQTLIKSDLKKLSNADFFETQEKIKRQYLRFWASQMSKSFCYSYMHCWAHALCTQTEVGECLLILVLIQQCHLWYWWLSSVAYCGGMTSSGKNYITYFYRLSKTSKPTSQMEAGILNKPVISTLIFLNCFYSF